MSDLAQLSGSSEKLALYRRLCAWYCRAGDRTSVNFAVASMHLGACLLEEGRHEEALACLRPSLAIHRKLLPHDHPSLPRLLLNIASAERALGKRGFIGEQAIANIRAVQRRSQTRCAGPDCTRMLGEDGQLLQQCSGCLRTFYCSAACQTADWWAGHKAECKALISQSAVAAAAAPQLPTRGSRSDGGGSVSTVVVYPCEALGCTLRLKPGGAPLDLCGGCKRVSYCSKACQKADRVAGHRIECLALVAASAAAAVDS